MAIPSSSVMRWLRSLSWIVLFVGWMIPLGLAALADRSVPGSGGPFRWIAGVWLVLALFYAVVVAVRARRGLVR